jgi:beta-galactosidase
VEVARAVTQPDTKTTLPLPGAKPWNPEHPYLYTLTARLVQDCMVQDEERAQFGVRTIALDRERGLLLNGQPIKLKGGCVHHDNGILGAKSHPDAERRKVRLLKEAGFNAIRCAHNPPSQVFLDACDALGMLVIDEAFDVWNEGKKQLDEHITFASNWEKDLRAMIGRDHNHPCILFWSTGNEIVERFGTSGGYAWAERLAQAVRELDPTRYLTNAVCGAADEMKELGDENADFFERRTAPFLAPLDAAGYNYLLERYEKDHALFPQRLFMGTESFPIEALDNWEAVQKHPYVLGDFVWTAWDYLGESGIGRDIEVSEGSEWGLGVFPIHQANCGDLDICGFKRPQSHFRDFVWSGREAPYVAVRCPDYTGKPEAISRWGWVDLLESWNWPGHEGQPIEVTVYAAGKEATLLLDGELIEAKPIVRYTARFTLPYQPGVLTVKTDCGEASLATTGEAVGFRLTPETEPGIVPVGGLVYVKIEAVDAQGRLVPDANLPFAAVPGEGYDLYALGCGDIAGAQNYTANQCHTFRGRAMAVLIKTAAASDCPVSIVRGGSPC